MRLVFCRIHLDLPHQYRAHISLACTGTTLAMSQAPCNPCTCNAIYVRHSVVSNLLAGFNTHSQTFESVIANHVELLIMLSLPQEEHKLDTRDG